MDGDKTVSSSSGKNKQSREQKRRHLTKSASHDRSSGADQQPPVFGRPAVVEKKDSELYARLHNVFGDYNNYKTAMKWEKQTSYFGVADATPSTPIQGSKYSPFDSEFRAASSRGAPSSSGTSSSNKHTSRHQVAEPPTSSQQYVNKKDKSRTKLHPKHSSKTDASSQQQQLQRPASSLTTVVKSNHKGEVKKLSTAAAEGSSLGEMSQASNVLKSKPKKEKVRPYKPVTGQNATTVLSSTSSSHAKNAPPTSSSSLFDFNAPTVSSGTSNNSLSIHRSSSNSSTTSTSSKPKPSIASERPSSVSSNPSSRHGDSHITPSHSNSATISHKHSKKLAPVPPTFGSSAGGGKSQEVDSPRVVSIKRTNSLEFVKQTPSWDKGVTSETMPPAVGEASKGEPHSTGKTKGKKKEKKLRKKLKKDKEMAAEKKVDISSLPMSHTVVSPIGHVSTAESHMTTKPLAAHVKVEPTRSRPSDLKITTNLMATGGAPPAKTAEPVSASSVDEESQDTGDIHSMLQEMMKPLNHSYSLVTPISTPIKARPFVFPSVTTGQVSSVSVLGSSEQDVFKRPSTSDASHQRGVVSATHSRKLSSASSSDDDWDTDSKMAVDMAVSALDLNLAEERGPPQQRPASPALSVSSSSSSSAESSSDSSDSSSEGEGEEGEEEGEESESNITPTLEKLHRQTQLSSAAITPLKKTPPRVGLLSTSSLLTDESANLSPAKPLARLSTSSFQSHSNDSMLVNQISTGFNMAPIAQIDSSDSDSGSESDSESSDSEDDQSSGEEDNNSAAAAGRTENSGGIKRSSIPSYDDMNTAPFGSSTGFFDDGYDLLGATSQFGEPQPPKPLGQQEGQDFHEEEAMDTGSSNSNTVASNSNSEKHSRIGRKRKHSSAASHFSLRKAQKFMNTIQLSSDAEDGEALSHNPNAPSTLRPLATAQGEIDSKKKSSSHHHLSVSEMYEDDEEEGEIPSDDEEQARKPPSRQQSMEASSELPPHQQHTATDLSLRANQGGATSSGSGLESSSMKQEEEEEGETNSLVVSFQLSSIPKLPLQKPKATVEPFFHNNTSTSKVARRRNTMDAPGERDGDEVHPRGMSRERGERSTYNRHRDEYGGRDYHRAPRPHRDNSARWDRDSSRDRRMYGSSEERSGRHGSGRHGGWDRDGDYHRSNDDYWMDGGGTHYDRGARDYERGSRQPDRKRGAEYFMQEARRRKHEADKINIPGVDKAKAYMESVPYFMRHGDAIEHERQQQSQQWAESGGGALKRNPFKMYSDTLSVVRFCQNMAGDCKPLVVVCLRCQSILLWRMFQLKQASGSHVQKELQEFFVLPKGSQAKSPYPNNFSPLPSPASVSSTASNGSGGGAFPQDPSPSCSTSIPKHIYNKAAEHLTIAGYVNQSFDAWKTADSMMEQCREFFAKAERKCGRIYQFSSTIMQTANWVESMLRSLR